MNVKLRLDYFLMRRCLLCIGDNVNGVDITMNLKTWNSNEVNGADLSMAVKSFAPRKNNGSQTVPDDFPVVVTLTIGGAYNNVAGYFEWKGNGDFVVKSWKPDLEKLIEQQIEYDELQEIDKAIDENIEKIMLNAKGNNMPVYTQEMKEAGKCAPIDSKVQILNTSSFDLEYGEDILGLEVTVKSEPISIGKGNIIQVVEYENIAYCFETDMIFPFKSKEEIEMEKAKKKQVEYISKNYLVPQHLALQMQNNGDLAEIISPLESD